MLSCYNRNGHNPIAAEKTSAKFEQQVTRHGISGVLSIHAIVVPSIVSQKHNWTYIYIQHAQFFLPSAKLLFFA
jgi:hypothetical protein